MVTALFFKRYLFGISWVQSPAKIQKNKKIGDSLFFNECAFIGLFPRKKGDLK